MGRGPDLTGLPRRGRRDLRPRERPQPGPPPPSGRGGRPSPGRPRVDGGEDAPGRPSTALIPAEPRQPGSEGCPPRKRLRHGPRFPLVRATRPGRGQRGPQRLRPPLARDSGPPGRLRRRHPHHQDRRGRDPYPERRPRRSHVLSFQTESRFTGFRGIPPVGRGIPPGFRGIPPVNWRIPPVRRRVPPGSRRGRLLARRTTRGEGRALRGLYPGRDTI